MNKKIKWVLIVVGGLLIVLFALSKAGVFGKDDIARFKGISKLPNVRVDNFEEANVGNLSATDLRNAIVNKDISTIQSMMPDGIDAKEYIQTLAGQKKLQEAQLKMEIVKN